MCCVVPYDVTQIESTLYKPLIYTVFIIVQKKSNRTVLSLLLCFVRHFPLIHPLSELHQIYFQSIIRSVLFPIDFYLLQINYVFTSVRHL